MTQHRETCCKICKNVFTIGIDKMLTFAKNSYCLTTIPAQKRVTSLCFAPCMRYQIPGSGCIHVDYVTEKWSNYVSKSDILGPIDYLRDIENLVSLERAMFEDYGFKYRIKIFQLFMLISILWNTCLEHHEHSTFQT